MSMTVLKRAGKLFHRRKFSSVVRLLEQQIFRFRDNPDFYTLLGKSCLYSGDYGGASSYLQRSEQLREGDVTVLLAMAAVALKRSDQEEALDRWLQVVDLDPGNRIARRGLDLLRRVGGGSLSLSDVQAPERFDRLLPPIPVRSIRVVLPLALVLIAAGAFSGLYFLQPKIELPRLFQPAGKRPDLPDITLVGSRPSLTDDTGSGFTYRMTDDEVRTTFDRAKEYLAVYRDNLAVREINRILHSNASAYTKEKARTLGSFVRVPDFTTVSDPFPYLEVLREPRLYDGGFAVWRGKVANLSITADRITFDLLVGYEQEKELLGIVPVSLGFAVNLENGNALEVLGRVWSAKEPLRLEGLSVHRLRGL